MQDDINPDRAEQELGEIDNVVSTRGYGQVPVVGLGGSAGSIEALQKFFRAISPDTRLAFVVVVHLSPDHESTLHELIQRCTTMPVVQSHEIEKIEPGHVYVIPPGRSIHSMDGSLYLAQVEGTRGRLVAVDVFFRTLADTHGPHAAAVVLSGAQSDGAVGIKRVKERGGLTISQDPDDAAHEGMPRSAIATGMVDWVLPVSEMPARIEAYFQLAQELTLPPEDPSADLEPEGAAHERAFRDVLTFVRARTGRDFSLYKRATVLRRVARRMQINGIVDMPAYRACLRTRPGETSALVQDLLITVTNFFRDPECYAALEREVPSFFAGKTHADTVRVWVVACATGEEAYSVAMLLREYATTMETPPRIQVFATDLDEEAIQVAREGLYPATIQADVSEERLKRFFVQEHRGWRVRRDLRENVLFAVHDALIDSPFSRVDLVTCRNLLIYLNREAQARLMQTFHFSLVPNGKLFLGSSESMDEGSPLFAVLDKKCRIFVQRGASRIGMPMPSGPSTLAHAFEVASRDIVAVPPAAVRPAQRERPAHDPRKVSPSELHLRLLEHLAPPSILVDGQYDIVHLSPGAGRFLQYGGGEPSRNLLRSVVEGLRIELRAALYQASQSRASVEVRGVSVQLGSEALRLTMRVMPAISVGDDLYLVTLDAEAAAANPNDSTARAQAEPLSLHLDQELERLKSHLRDTVEQYEASTEELRASNEELQAMNEELRSATEELETSREELQSINEELTTVNQELKDKVHELGHSNSDMHNLMDATEIATVFLDRELRITRFTPSAVALFNFIGGDIGRPLTDLTSKLAYPELVADARRVLANLMRAEREVGRADGNWYLVRLLPYRTLDDRIAGVVLSFVNITDRKVAEEMQLWQSAVARATPDSIVTFAMDQTILSWNRGAERIFGYAAEEAIGQPLQLLAADDGEDQKRLVARIAAGEEITQQEAVRRRKDGQLVTISIASAPIRDNTGRVMAGASISRDISAERAAQRALRTSEDQMRLVIENVRDYAIFSTDLERRVTSWNVGAERLLGWAEREAIGMSADEIFVPEDRAAGGPQKEAAGALADGRAEDERVHQRKDGSRFWGSGSMSAMRNEAGEVVGFVKILQDRSELHNALQALRRSEPRPA